MSDNSKNKILNWAIFIALIANVVVFSSFSSILISIIFNNNSESGEILRVARTTNLDTMDPCYSWYSSSNDMFNQVVETLIAYDLSDPELPLIGRLAESWYWRDNTSIEFKLRKNVFFHDGSKFTADCVLYTIARINYFGNWSGTLPRTEYLPYFESEYKFEDGLPIFNDTNSFATDDYNVTLILNRPFGPVEGLLAFTPSSIVHPDSTPENRKLDVYEDLVIGTGPFKLVRYIPNKEIRFARWERYWRTGAYWDQIIYVYYPNGVSANNAMLNGKIDWLGQGIASFKSDFETNPDITVTGNGVDDFISHPSYWGLYFKSEWVNLTWRKAICHAFNYSYLIHEIEQDNVVKANSLIHPDFPGHNASVTGGTYNIPYARQIMQSMGYGYTAGIPWDVGTQVGNKFYPGTNESLWKGASFIPDEGNYTYNTFYFYYRSISYSLYHLMGRFVEDMELIGVRVQLKKQCAPWEYDWDWCDWEEYYKCPKRCHIFFIGMRPNSFESYKMFEQLINIPSYSYLPSINNTEISLLLNTTMVETNTAQRYEYYKKLQYLIHDKYTYHMPLYYDKMYYVHASTLKGFSYNSMMYLYWYPTYRE